MVQILVKIKDDGKSVKEWAIVEIQGDLQSSTGDSVSGKLIGHIFFLSKGRPILIIGYHILLGKIVDANPPLAVLKRSRSPNVFTSTSPIHEDSNSSTDYTLLALVRKKITFRTRPKPIVSVCH